jgi:stage II sporulation protein D
MKHRAHFLGSRALTIVLAALFAVSPSHSFADPSPQLQIPIDFRFIGSGYGHGVGMSQVGARGQALEGKNAIEILNYYYPGTTVTAYPDNELIRVNIANLVNSLSLTVVGGQGEIRLYQGDVPMSENPEPFGIYSGDTTALFSNFAGSVVPLLSSPTTKFAPFTPANAWTVRWDSNTTTVALTNGAETSQYRYGQIVFKSVSTVVTSYLAVTNTLRLHDEYLWGLGEVPSSWPAAALEAQVIAARTYALGKLSKIRTECDCNIYNSTADQNFVGYAKETEAIYGIKWKEAVNRTFVDENNSLVITTEGKFINAFYFSSSGGNTQNIKEVWGTTFSYLQGVPDPWSLDPLINRRYAVWSRYIPQETMASAFELPNVISFSINSLSATGSITSITGVSSTGASSTLTGEIFRARVKLPSTWILNKKPIIRFPVRAAECPLVLTLKTPICFY